MSILTYIAGWPLLAALALVVVPRNYRVIIRAIAVLATLISAVLAVKMFCQFVPGANGYQFEQQIPWVESLGISYHVGVDGLNVGLILMGAIVAFAAALCSWEIQTREKEFYILLLVMTGGILGAFASLDLFFFYFLHELALVPTFIMIGVWGRGERKNYATFQITLYLSIGALIALIGLIALYLQSGANTFDIPKIIEHAKANPLAVNAQNFIFPLLLFGFGILVSLWPFHSWAPLGYGAAPSPTAMLHAGVLKKFGLYGLIRIALPLMPQAAHSWMHILAWLCLGNILVRRLGGDAAEGFEPAHRQFQRGAHGLHFPRHRQPEPHRRDRRGAHHDCARLPRGADVRVERLHLSKDRHAGNERARRALPQAAVHRHGAADGGDGRLRSAGLCEFRRRSHGVLRRVESCFRPSRCSRFGARWSSARIYMSRAVRNILHGPLPEKWNSIPDASNVWRKLPYALLLASLFVFGIWPRLLTEKINPDAQKIVAMAKCRLRPASQTRAFGAIAEMLANIADRNPGNPQN